MHGGLLDLTWVYATMTPDGAGHTNHVVRGLGFELGAIIPTSGAEDQVHSRGQ